MATTSTRKTVIQFVGGVVATEVVNAASNTASAGTIEIKTLASGANTITVPTAGTTPTAVTIIPPAGNTTLITLKGVTGDSGVALHATDPTSIALKSTVTSFVLTAASDITGVRLIWS